MTCKEALNEVSLPGHGSQTYKVLVANFVVEGDVGTRDLYLNLPDGSSEFYSGLIIRPLRLELSSTGFTSAPASPPNPPSHSLAKQTRSGHPFTRRSGLSALFLHLSTLDLPERGVVRPVGGSGTGRSRQERTRASRIPRFGRPIILFYQWSRGCTIERDRGSV